MTLLSRVKKLFGLSQQSQQNQQPFQKPAQDEPEIIAGNNSRKRKLEDCATLGSKRQRLAVDNIDQEEDVQIIHVPTITNKMMSSLSTVLKWFAPTKQARPTPMLGPNNTQINGVSEVCPVTKDDLNNPVRLDDDTIKAELGIEATQSSVEECDEPEVQVLKVVNCNTGNDVSILEETASHDALGQFKFDSPVNTDFFNTTTAQRNSNSVFSRFKVVTRKEQSIISHKNRPAILSANIKSGKKDRSVFSKFFQHPSRGKSWLAGSHINKEANELYKELLMRNTSTFLPTYFEKQGTYSSLFARGNEASSLFGPSSAKKRPSLWSTSTSPKHEELKATTVTDSASKSAAASLSSSRRMPPPASPLFSPIGTAPGKKMSADTDRSFVESTPRLQKERGSKLSSLQEDHQTKEVYSREFVNNIQEKYSHRRRELDRKIKAEETKKNYHAAKNEELYKDLDERILRHLKITSAELEAESKEDEEELEEDTNLPPITAKMEEEIKKAFESRGTLVEAYRIPISSADITTLRRLNWLNDEVINFYMQMIVARAEAGKIYAFNTFFYTQYKDNGFAKIKRWTKKVDLFTHELVLIPVHLGMHWCLATINFLKKKVCYYDSMGGNNQQCVDLLLQYLREEHQAKKGAVLDTEDWSTEIVQDIPQQMNGSDCGMFACKFAEYISRGAKITFTQDDMPYYRKRMVWEIINNQLLKP